jgi:pimeloyl-ACP methyl ester carboxylesterase
MRFLDRRPEDPEWGHARGPGIGGVRLHYVRRGGSDPVVLLHGWPGFWYDWRHVIVPLAEEADVVAIDFRGFGDSDKPEGDPKTCTRGITWPPTCSRYSTTWASGASWWPATTPGRS